MLVTRACIIDNSPVMIVNNGKIEVVLDIHRTIKRTQELETLFDKINLYQATLDQETSDRLLDILKTTVNLNPINMDPNHYNIYVKQLLHEAINLFNYDNFVNWFRHNSSDIVFPDNMIETFVFDPDEGNTVDKTYVMSEHVDFVGMTLFMRMLFPYYNNFIMVANERSRHPTYSTLLLFLGSRLDKSSTLVEAKLSKNLRDEFIEKELELVGYDEQVKQHLVKDKTGIQFYYETGEMFGYYFCAFDKLMDYSKVNYDTLNGNKNRQRVIMATGLTEDEAITFLVADIMFKKILLMDFFNPGANPISNIFNGIKYTSAFRANGLSDLKTKPITPTGSEEEYSFYENNRKTIDLALGTVVELQQALSNNESIIKSLGFADTFNYELFNEELQNVGIFMDKGIDSIKIYLMGWFMKSIINPRALFYIDRRRLAELMILTKVCLLGTDHDYIGTFLTCYKDLNSGHVSSSVITRSSLSKELLLELSEMFKFSIDDKGLTYEKTIIDFSKEICNIPWKIVGNHNKQYINSAGFLVAPTNINEVLIDYIGFVLEVGKEF